MVSNDIPLDTIAIDSPKVPLELPLIPSAPYRHAAPSAPWPWQNLDESTPEDSSSNVIHTHKEVYPSKECPGCHWKHYPESLFPNWKEDQVRRCKMKDLETESDISTIYHIEVENDGNFLNPTEKDGKDYHQVSDERDFDKFVEDLAKPRRVRVFCVDNLTVPVMQMLGTEYNIEPFFWSSCLNWIPARYQEIPPNVLGDHITITLKFARKTQLTAPVILPTNFQPDSELGEEMIDTRQPLFLRSKEEHGEHKENVLITDFLAIHMCRARENSTIITYHHLPKWLTTSASQLHTRIWLVGQSIYWQNIFERSQDPTFVLLATLWYALYAWDEAFETLWEHISHLELEVIDTKDMGLTHELHEIRAHLLNYASLLDDFYESVNLIKETWNPAMDSPTYTDADSENLLDKECTNLLTQIKRLKMSRKMWDKRLDNAMQLVVRTINIEDSQRMQTLTEAAVRDSAAMKQISYMTMLFLPASFTAAAFGMNVHELVPSTTGTVPHYIIAAVLLTLISTWILVAYQGQWSVAKNESMIMSVMKRLLWPVQLLSTRWTNVWKFVQPRDDESDTTVVNGHADI